MSRSVTVVPEQRAEGSSFSSKKMSQKLENVISDKLV